MPQAILAVAGESFAPNHPNVRPLGLISQDRLPQVLSAADVYVTPTLADNLPYTVLEAMGCSVPVVATNVGGIPEQVVDGETGLLVAPSQPAGLGAAILKVLSNPAQAKLMGSKGRQRVQDMYSMEPFVNAYERLFLGMMTQRQAQELRGSGAAAS
jgi:glycosyltransferase involved in cell wall biosynthesis